MLMQFQDFDAPYLDRLRSGDRSTQEHFAAYFGELVRLKLGKHLRSFAAIEDVQQETFARVLRVLTEKGIHQPERLGAFVNSVCDNVLHEHQRSAYRETPAEDGVIDGIPDSAIGVVDAIATRQTQQAVRQILDELSEKDRSLIKALFFEERDKDEVCCEFGPSSRQTIFQVALPGKGAELTGASFFVPDTIFLREAAHAPQRDPPACCYTSIAAELKQSVTGT